MQKIKHWLKRYIPAEVAGSVTAVVAGSIAFTMTHNKILTAYVERLGKILDFMA
jgi:hypothetical protein